MQKGGTGRDGFDVLTILDIFNFKSMLGLNIRLESEEFERKQEQKMLEREMYARRLMTTMPQI